MPADIALLWLRRGLRLADNPALAAAFERHDFVAPVYIDDTGSRWDPGPAARTWLTLSLTSLDESLRARGSRLTILSGPASTALPRLATAVGAHAVYVDGSHVAEIEERDARVGDALASAGAGMHTFDTHLLRDPSTPLTTAGRPYTVFTPYYNACRRLLLARDMLPLPGRMTLPPHLPSGIAPADVSAGVIGPPLLAAHFTPGEAGAVRALDRFISEGLEGYATDRDRPDLVGTSRLSPHLAFGEISPARVHQAVRAAVGATADTFDRQLYWREFGNYLLHHFPHTATRPLRAEYEAMPWANDPGGVAAWREGQTGYPIVDAGMREMAATGWMHNRVRMLVASFLTKDLLAPWQTGERTFWQHLTDADAGNNTLGWQWVAGSGADAVPYFRVFNPVTQGDRFDPDGTYVRTWLPELADVPNQWIHQPWEAPDDVLAAAGVTLDGTYPAPVLDHPGARLRALAAYDFVRAARR
ncbi:MAG: deoxyribodipyrimidine photo-lyase [Coriobacteriia bacterium]|nr:deoxyribodipyrimidine photo-lyase [Coriobacteriia bacterium]